MKTVKSYSSLYKSIYNYLYPYFRYKYRFYIGKEDINMNKSI